MLVDDSAQIERQKAETRVWLQILSLESVIFSRLNKMLKAEFGLSVAKFEFLAQVDRYPRGITLGRISELLRVTNGNVSGLVRRLLADELITKCMSQEDRRSFIVNFSPKGRKLFDNANQRCRKELANCFSGVTSVQLDEVLNSLRFLNSHVQRDRG